MTSLEKRRILHCIQRANTAIVALQAPFDAETIRATAHMLAAAFALGAPQAHEYAQSDSFSAIIDQGSNSRYIPYTNQALNWHTDGYYHYESPQNAVKSMILACVQDGRGGDNRLIDHDILYIRLRDMNPEYIAALSAPDVLTIPANGPDREANIGPVFYQDGAGRHLALRYTARTRNAEWRNDALTHAAAQAIREVLLHEPLCLRVHLLPGQILLANNVPHDRTEFTEDSTRPRCLLRGRYYNRFEERKSSWTPKC
ncbi:MAG: TauD/TfdA family dioxygenase [Alphaproteobacteria bacterium]|nr:TauD/TfdA family dioxygenase [Alphaproteobacteria bacterium]